MTTIWCVTYATTERHFAKKADALRHLRAVSNDSRLRPVCVRQCAGAYTYYGPGRDEIVLRANIDRLSFASLRSR